MSSVGVLIFLTTVGPVICARARGGGAVIFGALAVVLFVATPVGSGVPGAVSSFVLTFDRAVTPVLSGEGGAR